MDELQLKEKMQKIVEYLEYEVKAYADTCGEDDDVNYKPAKKALDLASEVLAYLETTTI